MFLRWLARAGVCGELHIAWSTRGPGPAPLEDEQRFAAVRCLLHDRDIDPRDRFAGLLLLLYAQPLTRTAALRTRDVATTADGQITITLARGAVALPAPLGSLAHALRYQRPTGADNDSWLLPGQKAGTHITAERLRERLTRYGITSRPSRHTALLALAARLPAPILAERLGFHPARAAQWVHAAGAPTATTSPCVKRHDPANGKSRCRAALLTPRQHRSRDPTRCRSWRLGEAPAHRVAWISI